MYRDLPLYFMLVDEHSETALRKLFQSQFPAAAGEFVWTISSEVYWKDLPAFTRLPGLIEIEMVLLGGYVPHEKIGSALGCPVSYLKGLDPNLFSDLYKPQLILEVTTCETGRIEKDDGLDVDVDRDPFLTHVYDTGKDEDDLYCTRFHIPGSPTCQQ